MIKDYLRYCNGSRDLVAREAFIAGELSEEALQGINFALTSMNQPPLEFLRDGDIRDIPVLLRNYPDSPQVFPKGKWATIQHLEHMIELYA